MIARQNNIGEVMGECPDWPPRLETLNLAHNLIGAACGRMKPFPATLTSLDIRYAGFVIQNILFYHEFCRAFTHAYPMLLVWQFE